MGNKNFTFAEFNHIVSVARYAAISTFNKNNYIHDNYDIEEVVSQTLERVTRNWDEYDETVSSSSWFYTIAKNCACSYMTLEGRWRNFHAELKFIDKDGDVYEPELYCEESSVSYQADYDLMSNERVAIINRELGKLGDKMGRAIMLQSQGYTLSEIQKLVGMEYGALRTNMSRGRKRLLENKEIKAMYTEFFGRDYSEVA